MTRRNHDGDGPHILREFEQHLESGTLLVPRCSECMQTVWPPAEFCSACMGAVRLAGGGPDGGDVMTGRVIECVREERETEDRRNVPNADGWRGRTAFACMVEFECGIRVIARMHSCTEPLPGDAVSLETCGIDAAKSCYVFGVAPAAGSPAKT